MDNLDMLKPSLRKRQKRRDKRMHEELIECYRIWRNHAIKKHKGYQKMITKNNYEFAPQKEGIKFMGNSVKHFDDNLGPLKRYLEKNTGRKWDSVYSELCKKVDKNSVVGQHLYSHLWDFVDTYAFKENGVWMSKQYGSIYELGTYWLCRQKYFVHPESGILMKVKRKKR